MRISSDERYMESISTTLKKIRLDLGFKSARSFYLHLNSKTTLVFNYQHYMKIEKAQIQPTAKFIHNISSILPSKYSDLLVVSYCKSLFPGKPHLFQNNQVSYSKDKDLSKKSHLSSPTIQTQQILSNYQVAGIAKSKNHYFSFLILTLSRSPISSEDLALKLKLKSADVSLIISDLAELKLISMDMNSRTISSTSSELKFPSLTPALSEYYKKIDAWNLEIGTSFEFQTLQEKMMIRRISPRYIDLVLKFSNAILDLVRSSEETELKYNDDILYVNFTIQKGSFPG